MTTSEKRAIILGIETSCDDTSVCLLRDGTPPEILGHTSFSQEVILKKWGGVVPEIAARNHLMKLVPLLQDIFDKVGILKGQVDLIGVTTHPGLLGPLLTGLNVAKTLSMFHEIPIVPVNHLYAHLEAIHLHDTVEYPYLGLLVSGGHSLYLLANSSTEFEILGSTIDDAAGEAFDKGGKMMGLGYPGGVIIDKNSKSGDENRFKFPIGLKNSGDCNLSFSGTKTSLRQFLEKNPDENIFDVCAGYQKSIVDSLALKLKFALKKALEISDRKSIPIIVGGGVACNSLLRKRLKEKFENVHFVKPEFCTDNGAMIANYAMRVRGHQAIPFPDCLKIDSRSTFIKKSSFRPKVEK